MTEILCNGAALPNFANAQTPTPQNGLFHYAHRVTYYCARGGYRFEDGGTTTAVTCSVDGWTWNYSVVTSCGRTSQQNIVIVIVKKNAFSKNIGDT